MTTTLPNILIGYSNISGHAHIFRCMHVCIMDANTYHTSNIFESGVLYHSLHSRGVDETEGWSRIECIVMTDLAQSNSFIGYVQDAGDSLSSELPKIIAPLQHTISGL